VPPTRAGASRLDFAEHRPAHQDDGGENIKNQVNTSGSPKSWNSNRLGNNFAVT
jgi:hypothetical protein